MNAKKKIALLGSTGSIGRSTLKVIRHLKDEFQIVALAAKTNLELLEQQVLEFRPLVVSISDKDLAETFKKRMPQIRVVSEIDGLCEIASMESVDIVVLAMTGMMGLHPMLAAIQSGKQIALANKEILVAGGEFIMQKVRKQKIQLIPIDSEHSALFQCLQGNDQKTVRRLILTASGGPFRTFSLEQLKSITVSQALAHPNWKMGAKITVDSSTLMNKGLELIEAHFLFDCPPKSMDVIVHPESIIHSIVEYQDGAMLAQMSEPDMILPIQFALTYPNRKPGIFSPFSFLKHPQLTFETPDRKKFPCLRLAEEALQIGKSMLCFMNAANEVLVNRFLQGEIRWIDIPNKLEKLMSFHHVIDVITLDAILGVDKDAREKASNS